MNLKQSLITLLGTAMLTSCGGNKKVDAPLLTMHFEGEAPDMLLNYSPEGNIFKNQAFDVSPDSLGNFVFNPELPDDIDFVDGTIYIGEDVYGYFIEKGKSLEMNVKFGEDGTVDVSYSGDNAKEAEVNNVIVNAFDLVRYMPMTGEELAYEEYDSILNVEAARARESVKALEGEHAEYFGKLAEAYNVYYAIRNITNNAESAEKILANENYRNMVAGIDPNDPISAKTNLIFLWINDANAYKAFYGDNNVANSIEELKVVNEKITYPKNREMAFESVASSLFNYTKPTKEEMKEFLDQFAAIAPDQKEMIDRYAKRMENFIEINNGDAVPYNPTLERPDGSTVKLSDLKGKPLYIDIWATWCGPCCREIPFLEKVVEKTKDNKNLRIISISCDEDRDAWVTKVKNDNPQWEQFRFVGDEGNNFMTKLGISGIPRFIMLDADGKFIAADAMRPSDENIVDKLNEISK